jgi:hypothetical protein
MRIRMRIISDYGFGSETERIRSGNGQNISDRYAHKNIFSPLQIYEQKVPQKNNKEYQIVQNITSVNISVLIIKTKVVLK